MQIKASTLGVLHLPRADVRKAGFRGDALWRNEHLQPSYTNLHENSSWYLGRYVMEVQSTRTNVEQDHACRKARANFQKHGSKALNKVYTILKHQSPKLIQHFTRYGQMMA